MIIRLLVLLFSIPLLLSGCVSFQDTQNGLNTLKGKPLSYAISRIGYPDKQENIEGTTVYMWTTKYDSTHYNKETSYSGDLVTYVPVTETNYCKIFAAVDKKHIVSDIQFKGNLGGCAKYAKLVKQEGANTGSYSQPLNGR